jgi:hypothetical protein
MKNSTKIVAKNAAALAAGIVINRLIDRKLAKAENPGRFNKWYRRQLKRWLYITPVLAAPITALEVYITPEPAPVRIKFSQDLRQQMSDQSLFDEARFMGEDE